MVSKGSFATVTVRVRKQTKCSDSRNSLQGSTKDIFIYILGDSLHNCHFGHDQRINIVQESAWQQ